MMRSYAARFVDGREITGVGYDVVGVTADA
jgi:hypothetical protein